MSHVELNIQHNGTEFFFWKLLELEVMNLESNLPGWLPYSVFFGPVQHTGGNSALFFMVCIIYTSNRDPACIPY